MQYSAVGTAVIVACMLTPVSGVAAPKIQSITVCSTAIPGKPGSCAIGNDTAKPVLAPDGLPLNGPRRGKTAYGGLSTLSDEHQTVMPPGTLPGQTQYLFFVASRTSTNPAESGLVVLSGNMLKQRLSAYPDDFDWQLDFAPGYSPSPTGAPGQLLESAMAHNQCPAGDPTFDLNYGAPGTVFVNPVASVDEIQVLAIYEGTNRCIGRTAGTVKRSSFYSTIGIATSLYDGRVWPLYRSNYTPLPLTNQLLGPEAEGGTSGAGVTFGNALTPYPGADYGRVAVISPAITIHTAMQSSSGPLSSGLGNSEPAAFVDDIAPGSDRYLYVTSTYVPGTFPQNSQLPGSERVDIVISRAKLMSSAVQMQFRNWYVPVQTASNTFIEPALGNDTSVGGRVTPIFAGRSVPSPDTPEAHCLSRAQARTSASINYVEDTQQYLLMFICRSSVDPATRAAGPGASWFYSTLDLSPSGLADQSQWSVPRQIEGSWAAFTKCVGGKPQDYKGWYPTAMSVGIPSGHLSTQAESFVFFMHGCEGDRTVGGRVYSVRRLKMTAQ